MQGVSTMICNKELECVFIVSNDDKLQVNHFMIVNVIVILRNYYPQLKMTYHFSQMAIV